MLLPFVLSIYRLSSRGRLLHPFALPTRQFMNRDSSEQGDSSWKGHVVARNLPRFLDSDFAQQNKLLDRQVDPSLFEAQAGELRHRLNQPRFSPDADTPTVDTAEETGFDGLKTEISAYIYPQREANEHNLVVHLQRDSDEQLVKTLRRMQISLCKKLPVAKSNTFKKKQKKSKQKKKNASSQFSDLAAPTIWTADPQSGSIAKKCEVPESTLCGELWKRALKEPLAISVPLLPDISNEPLLLWIDSCPPTITSVNNFGKFEGYLFSGTPILVTLGLLYATDVIVDWYADTKLVQHNSRLYVPADKDVGKELTVLIRPTRSDHDGAGYQEAYRFSRKVEPLPTNLLLQLRPEFTKARDDDSKADLRVLTYNILADQNCESKNYPYCRSEVLAKQRRMPLIIQEILAYQPDVICLQEVDEHIFVRLLQPVLKEYSYEGFFSCKTGQNEGCAIFSSSSRFDKSDATRQTYFLRDQLPFEKPSESEDATTHAVFQLIEKRSDLRQYLSENLGHIVQLAGLRDRISRRRIWIANTHLFYHSKGNHIRTLQMWALARQVRDSITSEQNHTGASERDPNPGVIIAGDFNSSLENSCGKLLVDGEIPANHRRLKRDLNLFHWDRERRRDASIAPTDDDDFPAMRLPEDFPSMHSAFAENPTTFTHVVEGFKGNLDHIVVSSVFRTSQISPMPSLDQIIEQTAMPSENLPSDHVSLVCDLRYC